MRNLLRVTLLGSVIAVGMGVVAPTSVGASDSQTQPVSGASTFLVEFAEPGLLHHSQELRGRGDRFDPQAPETIAYRVQLQQLQADYKEAIANELGRDIKVTHHYLATHSGIALELSESEAQVLRGLDGIAKVERDRVYQLDTDTGPTFIGAPGIWDGSTTPTGDGTHGEGMVVAILDTGIAPTHPSFANDPFCGFDAGNPKVLSSLDCGGTAPDGMCNGPNPNDTDGHGSHVASTAAGNFVGTDAVPAPSAPISGVAPCANIRAYKVCPGQTCPGAAIQAGMDSVLLHGDVDVMNFSISGGTSPWSDNDRRKLDLVDAGVLVAASAGNTSASIPNPVGQVNHRGPWVMTVASSTHEDDIVFQLSASGPGTPPPGTQNIPTTKGSASPDATQQTDLPIRYFDGQPDTAEGCTAGEDTAPPDLEPFPDGFFNGAAALIHRGTCPFTVKINNAYAAGAELVIIRNNQPAPMSMDTTGQEDVPAYSIEQAPGNALFDFVDANDDATIDFDPTQTIFADTLSGFSFRGPTPAPLQHLQKPDITGPGDSVYAAVPGGYANIGGTSMSSPHLAGAGTLVRAVQPDWTPPEVKSAIMMTASREGYDDDGVSPWDWDDVGSGRVDLSKATLAGLVMDETVANYLAANPGSGGDIRTLNIPAVRDVSCEQSCSWTRTVSSTQSDSVDWTVEYDHPEGFVISVSPDSFTLAAGADQELTITATPQAGEPGTAIRFGLVELVPSNDTPDLHITVAVQGQGDAGPTPEIDLSLNLHAIPSTVENGGSVSVIGSVANFGVDSAPDVELVVTLPDGFSFAGARTGDQSPLTLASMTLDGDKGVGMSPARGTSWDCSASGSDVVCSLAGALPSFSFAPGLALDLDVATSEPGVFTVEGEVSSSGADGDPSNNVASVDIEVTGETIVDIIFQDGFEGEPVIPEGACLIVDGSTANGPLRSGDPSNTVWELDIGTGNELTGVGADLSVEAFDPSWLSESVINFGNSDPIADSINLTPSAMTAPGTDEYSSLGVITFADIPLPNVVVGADGILRLERFESFDDAAVDPDSVWGEHSDPFDCQGIYLQCLDQEACDAAVAAANAP